MVSNIFLSSSYSNWSTTCLSADACLSGTQSRGQLGVHICQWNHSNYVCSALVHFLCLHPVQLFFIKNNTTFFCGLFFTLNFKWRNVILVSLNIQLEDDAAALLYPQILHHCCEYFTFLSIKPNKDVFGEVLLQNVQYIMIIVHFCGHASNLRWNPILQ